MSLGITPDRRERWCKPVEPIFLQKMNGIKPKTMEDFARVWYTHSGGSYSDWRRCAMQHYDSSRCGAAPDSQIQPSAVWPMAKLANLQVCHLHLLNLHAAFSEERPAHTIEFRAFEATLHAGKIKAYIQLCLAISAQALAAGTDSPRRPETDNPKYTFRCWLLRLGFIGDEFATAREHLLKNLPSNAAWRQAS